MIRIEVEVLGLDSTSVKVHPDGIGATKKGGPQAIGKSRGGWNTKIHLVAADAQTAVEFSISPGQDHDAPHGRQLVQDLGYTPVIPPIRTRRRTWTYDRTIYRRRNEVERLFRRLKGYRRIFPRYDKTDVMFTAFITLALSHTSYEV